MLSHNIKYNLLVTLRTKETLFWSLLFPIALATFMFLAFGKINKLTEDMKAIDVAVVDIDKNEMFKEVVDEVSDGDSALLAPEYVSEESAKKLLDDDKVFGILYVNEDISLTVKNNGLEQTIIESFINRYMQTQKTVMSIAETNPAAVAQAVDTLTSDTSYYKECRTTDGNTDNLINFFYAIFAMSCLFSSFTGISGVLRLQANLSPLGQRRCVAPTRKLTNVFTIFFTNELIQFTIECITLVYMTFVLKLDFGDKIPGMLLLLFLGSSLGLSMGMFIGALPKPVSEGGKTAVGVSVSMALSVLADLCVNGIMDAINHTAPIINKINPAALISDSFYALNTYESYDRYFNNIICMLIITAVLFVSTIMMIRRNRYASI